MTDSLALISQISEALVKNHCIGRLLLESKPYMNWLNSLSISLTSDAASPTNVPTAVSPFSFFGSETNKYVAAKIIDKNQSMMPQDNRTTDYSSVVNEYVNQVTKLDTHNKAALLNNILLLCEICFSTTPNNDSTVSLYNTLRSMVQRSTDCRSFIMLGGDICGIQNFIYDVPTKGAAKSLQGRSFYVQLILDAVLQYTLTTMGLGYSSVIYNSGGSFYVLIPADDNAESKIASIKQYINKQIYCMHSLKLYVAINYVSVEKDLSNWGESWDKLFIKRERQKNSQYADLIPGMYDELFSPYAYSGSVTEPDYEKLGSEIRKSNCMIISQDEIEAFSTVYNLQPGGLGYYYYMCDRKELLAKYKTLSGKQIVLFNDYDTDMSLPAYYKLEYYSGNSNPIDVDGNLLSFEDLVGEGADLHRLGVLRMDVDNLGATFRRLNKMNHSDVLASISSVSKGLDWFFKGHIDTIHKKYSGSVSVIYSGGDDLFVVGKWTDVMNFAADLRAEFDKYTLGNLSLSAGIAIVEPKYPIIRSAEMSGNKESTSKRFDYNGFKKNSLTFFDLPLRWDVEFKSIKVLSDEMSRLVTSKQLEKSLIGKILTHYMNAVFESGQIVSKRSVWLLVYDLARMKTRTPNDAGKAFLTKCMNDITANTLDGQRIGTPYHSLQIWGIAARLAELKIRS